MEGLIGRTDAEIEAPILWPSDAKNWLIGKDPDAGRDWRQEEKGTTEKGMVGWHHWLNGHEFEQAPGVGDGQRSLACCNPWGHKELDMTEWLNCDGTELNRSRSCYMFEFLPLHCHFCKVLKKHSPFPAHVPGCQALLQRNTAPWAGLDRTLITVTFAASWANVPGAIIP